MPAILKFVRENKIPFVVKGGGHSTSGSASIENGLVVDLAKMRKVVVDVEKKTIIAEGGTLWVDVDEVSKRFIINSEYMLNEPLFCRKLPSMISQRSVVP